MRIDFECKPTYGYDDKYIKIKIKKYEKYYSQTFLEECKYVQEKIKFENYIDEELDSDSGNDE